MADALFGTLMGNTITLLFLFWFQAQERAPIPVVTYCVTDVPEALLQPETPAE